MVRIVRIVSVVSCLSVAALAEAQQAGPTPSPAPAPATTPAPDAGDWKPMDSTRAARPLPAQSPMSTDLAPRAVNRDVPLPPPPAGTAAAGRGAAVDLGAKAPAAAPAEPEVKVVGDQTGIMLEAKQKLESDEIRQRWAQRGGTITGYEVGLGATLMFQHKDMSATAGSGAYMEMAGGGLNAAGRVTLYSLRAPQYETRDRSWTALKLGGGIDMAAFGVTSQFYTPIHCYVYVGCIGGMDNSSASMSQVSLVGTLGAMKAWGSFDSPDEWSGTAVGIEWAPTYTSTTVTPSKGDPVTSKAFNATGFAIDFQSGSLKTLAMSTAKPAHWKIRVFFLPPVGDVPFIVTTSFNASWY